MWVRLPPSFLFQLRKTVGFQERVVDGLQGLPPAAQVRRRAADCAVEPDHLDPFQPGFQRHFGTETSGRLGRGP